jgi:AraC family transcriptional regulator
MTCTSLCSSHIASILRVLVYIEAHLDEPLLLEHLAQVARVSPFHFHRLFRAYTGETCMGYIQRLRLQRAEEKLRYTEDSITRISQDVGYETPAGFSKFFQQTLGRSPREYRKAIQPVVKTMVARALSSPAWTPQYVVRKKESVLFVRRIGDYKETPELLFRLCMNF